MIDRVTLVGILDAVADSLESKGFVKEAAEVDIVSNTIEANETHDLASLRNIAKELHEAVGRGNKDEVERLRKEFAKGATVDLNKVANEYEEKFVALCRESGYPVNPDDPLRRQKWLSQMPDKLKKMHDTYDIIGTIAGESFS